jgi:acyl-CoA dehydrogenase
VELPNVIRFNRQVEFFREILIHAPATREQSADIDYMLAAGELFTLIAYAQLILENASIYGIDNDLLDEIFAFLVRDFSSYALEMVLGHVNTPRQEEIYRKMILKPAMDRERFDRLWENHVLALRDQYRMKG